MFLPLISDKWGAKHPAVSTAVVAGQLVVAGVATVGLLSACRAAWVRSGALSEHASNRELRAARKADAKADAKEDRREAKREEKKEAKRAAKKLVAARGDKDPSIGGLQALIDAAVAKKIQERDQPNGLSKIS